MLGNVKKKANKKEVKDKQSTERSVVELFPRTVRPSDYVKKQGRCR